MGQREEVLPFDVGQTQGPGGGVRHPLRDVDVAAPFQPDVVVYAHPGELGHLLAAQTRHPAGRS